MKIDNFPLTNSISVLFLVKLFNLPAKAVAQAAVPHAFVKPAPLSQTLTFIRFSLITLAIVTLNVIIKMQKFTTFLGSLLAIAFLVGLAFTLTRSSMIGFFDVLPVYILMGIAIFMMVYEAFFDKK